MKKNMDSKNIFGIPIELKKKRIISIRKKE